MPNFYYKGVNKVGHTIEGFLEALNEQVVATHLQRLEITPIFIFSRPKHIEFSDLPRYIPLGRPSLNDLSVLANQMHRLLKGGVPVNRALQVVIESTKQKVLMNALTNILLDLESGRSLAYCFKKQGYIFPEFIAAMIDVGEKTGQLEDVFLQIHHYLQTEAITKKRIKSALRYPLIVMGAILFAITIINLFVIPAFEQFFNAWDAELPFATQWLIQISGLFVTFWPLGLGALVGLFILYFYALKKPKYRYHWDKFKLRLPWIGSIIHRAILARFTRSLAMAHQSGLPLLDAIEVVAQSADNHYITKKLLRMRLGLEKGEMLSVTAQQAGIFSPLVIQMILVGEETGHMDENLIEIANHYEADVDYDIKQLNDVLEPILIAVIAGMVLILALGVFLPLWDLSSVAMHQMGSGS